ncbi:MAG: hypothetical protein ACOZAH_05490 [Pseudomonadota bacterium]
MKLEFDPTADAAYFEISDAGTIPRQLAQAGILSEQAAASAMNNRTIEQ